MKNIIFAFLLVVGVFIDFMSIIFICSSINGWLLIVTAIAGAVFTVAGVFGTIATRGNNSEGEFADKIGEQPKVICTYADTAESDGKPDKYYSAEKLEYIQPRMSEKGNYGNYDNFIFVITYFRRPVYSCSRFILGYK